MRSLDMVDLLCCLYSRSAKCSLSHRCNANSLHRYFDTCTTASALLPVRQAVSWCLLMSRVLYGSYGLFTSIRRAFFAHSYSSISMYMYDLHQWLLITFSRRHPSYSLYLRCSHGAEFNKIIISKFSSIL